MLRWGAAMDRRDGGSCVERRRPTRTAGSPDRHGAELEDQLTPDVPEVRRLMVEEGRAGSFKPWTPRQDDGRGEGEHAAGSGADDPLLPAGIRGLLVPDGLLGSTVPGPSDEKMSRKPHGVFHRRLDEDDEIQSSCGGRAF